MLTAFVPVLSETADHPIRNAHLTGQSPAAAASDRARLRVLLLNDRAGRRHAVKRPPTLGADAGFDQSQQREE